MRLAFLALAALPLLSGCFLSRSYTNDALAPEAIAALEPGRTTAAQVVDVLGAPAHVVELGERSAYLYEHRKMKRAGLLLFVITLLNEDVRSDRLWVFFDRNDRLTHFGATLSAERASYSLPFQDRE
jgi:outer membrane protein assembly factor BamE (lipoprotein component of BamABCDE complex)